MITIPSGFDIGGHYIRVNASYFGGGGLNDEGGVLFYVEDVTGDELGVIPAGIGADRADERKTRLDFAGVLHHGFSVLTAEEVDALQDDGGRDSGDCAEERLAALAEAQTT